MKTLEELIAEFDGMTVIQQEEHLKELIGVEVEVLGEIRNIDAEHVDLRTDDWNLLRWPLPPLYLGYGTLIFINYKNSQLGNQLLKYSSGDGVKLATRLKGARFAPYSAHYTFDLLSIIKLNTLNDRENAAKEASQKETEQDKGGCFVATAAYGPRDPNVLILKQYRDLILAKTFAGRSAIRLYYRASPSLARFIEGSDRQRSRARLLLGPFVLLARRQVDCLARNGTEQIVSERRKMELP
jgi:hypothetical protein